MLKKIVIGVLAFSVVAAVAAALVYPLMSPAAAEVAAPVEIPAVNNAALEAAEASPAPAEESPATMGKPWSMEGTISALDDTMMSLLGADGVSVMAELGPSSYWMNQGVPLAVGDMVTASGMDNEGQIHIYQVQTASGQTLMLRSESGAPLWSGGSENGQNGDVNAEGTHQAGTPEIQVAADQWVTITGTLTAVSRGNFTVLTDDGQSLRVQLGRPDFATEQGVSFAAGDEVSILGYWEGAQFRAGEVTQISTGLRLMLLDPNGRPLWAGPGNGNGNGNGQGGDIATTTP